MINKYNGDIAFFIKWGILFGLFILPLARKGVSSESYKKNYNSKGYE